MVEPLPHQITAVCESLLPRRPLRFPLADDPGSGKTSLSALHHLFQRDPDFDAASVNYSFAELLKRAGTPA